MMSAAEHAGRLDRAHDARPAYQTLGFWAIVASVVAVDAATKALAVRHLTPRNIPHEVLGDLVRFMLAYNPGAAFGMHVGAASRWFFASLSVVIVIVLLRVTSDLTMSSPLARLGVPTVIGGAFGNLLDRILYRDGVVDFIDVGLGENRFWTFNVADSAVTIGAICLVLALWQHERTHSAVPDVRASG